MQTDYKEAAPHQLSLKASSGVFVGVGRNCESHLGGVLENLARLGAQYGRASYIFGISDSKDETAPLLENWLTKSRVGQVIRLGDLEPKLPLRTERIAFARNACLDKLRHSEEANYDHLIVVDLDDVLATPISIENFVKAACWLDAGPARGAVFANGRPRYYDVWALRHETWCPHDCWHRVQFPDPGEDMHIHDRMIREVYSRMVAIPPWLPPIRVLSAFGGIGIYRMPFTKAARYVGIDARGRETCEHVAFNASVRDAGGTIHIFPALTVKSPVEHSYEGQRLPAEKRPFMIRRRRIETLHWWLTCPFQLRK